MALQAPFHGNISLKTEDSILGKYGATRGNPAAGAFMQAHPGNNQKLILEGLGN